MFFVLLLMLFQLLLLYLSKIKMKLLYNILVFIVGYLAQDLSHYLTNESTYQSSYISQNFIEHFTEHTYYLLPLIITSSIKSKLIYNNTILYKLLGILPILFVYTTDYLSIKRIYCTSLGF